MRLLTAVSGVRVPQQAPEKKPNGFFFIFLFLLLSRTPYAVFGLHDSRVQIRCRKRAIPSHSALLTGVRVRGQAPEKKPNGFFFIFLFLLIVSFFELLIFRFLSVRCSACRRKRRRRGCRRTRGTRRTLCRKSRGFPSTPCGCGRARQNLCRRS